MNALKTQLAAARTWWSGLAPRERMMVAAMAAVLGVALLWSLSDWIKLERKRLAKALPTAQARLAAMRDDAAEVQRLQRAQARPAAPAASLADPLQASARSRGLTLEVRVDGSGLRATGGGSFDAFVEWLAEVQRDHGMRVTRLTTSRAASGTSIDVELQPAGAQ